MASESTPSPALSHDTLSSVMDTPLPPHRTSNPYCLASAQFEKQPPDNMRKSNFFHFIISLYDYRQQRVQVQKAMFKDFYDTTIDGQEYRNGLIYKLVVVYGDGTQREEELYVRLIDAATKHLVPYEGTNKNPDFRRVLLTHELICSRCLERRSCGNKNDTPSDPIIIDSFRLKIFAKCNQNCLKNAGNPKDSRRRFQVALFPADLLAGPPIAASESMFVHNNSKHGRRPIYRDTVVGDGKPCILSIYPNEGWTTGGTRITIIGINFFEGLDVVFGTVPVPSDVLSPNAIAVRTPPATMTGEVDVTLIIRASAAQFCVNNPGKFMYTAPEDQAFENSFCRIERVVRHQDDPDEIPKDIVLQRAAELLEGCFMGNTTRTSQSSFPFNQGGGGGALLPYPRSPALFGSNGVFLFTPQPMTPRLNGGGLLQDGPGNFGGYMQQGGDTYGRQGYASQTAFPFPDLTPQGNGGAMAGEVKTEAQLSSPGQGLHKPHPVQANGPMSHPYGGVAGYDGTNYSATMNTVPLSHGQQSNTNNNNSTMSAAADTSNIAATCSQMMNPMQQNSSLSYMSRILQGAIPPSPGFLMAHTFSPLSTPTCGVSGASSFNFGPPLLSPTKGRPSKQPRLAPISVPNDGTTLGVPIPSPQLGSFTFPPITPNTLVTPLNIHELTNSDSHHDLPLSESSTTANSVASNHSSLPHTPPHCHKRRADGSPVEL